jgi:hypothetical protein
MDFVQFFDQVGQWIPLPQAYNVRAYCNELLLVNTDWHNFTQVGKVVPVENGELYRKKGIDDRGWILTCWIINARTILVFIMVWLGCPHSL